MPADAADSAAPAPVTMRRGRRPGPNDTRGAILDAARSRFAADGYAAATIRRIALDAGVDAALVMRFYGSKDDLFAAAMSVPTDALQRLANAFDGPTEQLGERVTRAYLTLWEGSPSEYEPLLAMFRSAVNHEQAAAQLREFLQARFVEGIVPRLGDVPDAALRVSAASSLLLGVVVGRRIVKVQPVVEEDLETLVKLIAPAVQIVLAGP
ncbi:TetR family transcriptional regulator [Subtercola boreus]|uniref:TetR family transcriptional regulator n=1 Tax=Subtercola boreus TaxID=120213 RepID=A0A3E0VJV1_9MICO|nr:TetR family transcriptional regulator [Subtercola boreus]RFA10244.1 TetR family transcriptional regulator [Subtercola boreus]